MVLGVRLILPLAAVVAGCSGASDPTPEAAPVRAMRPSQATVLDRARIGQVRLELVGQGDDCVLRSDGRDHALDIPAPGRFLHRDRAAEPTVENYGDRGRVLVVAGPPAPAGDYSEGSAETPADRCASIARPVLERGGRLALGEIMPAPAGYCPDIGLDEKFYYGVAHAKPFAERLQLR